jgi:hypothetical protein
VALLLIGCAPTAPGITITWSTGSELSIAGFVVERSDQAAGPFERVSPFIPASDDVLVGHDYQFTDDRAMQGRTYWYRLLTVSPSNSLVALGTLSATAP